MAIPLVAVPPPAAADAYPELVTGDASEFTAGIGAWAAGGGAAVSWDALGGFGGRSHQLKIATTGIGQYGELVLPGTFLAGQTYQMVIATYYSSAAPNVNVSLLLGDPGAADKTEWTGFGPPSALHDWLLWHLKWTPSADRTAVRIRYGRNGSTTGSVDFFVGFCRASRVRDSIGQGYALQEDKTGTFVRLPGGLGGAIIRGSNGASFHLDESVFLDEVMGNSNLWISSGGMSVVAASGDTPARRTGNGFDVEVGTDFVGVLTGERDSTTVEMYPDYGDYDVVLLDGSADGDTRHWWHEEADGAYNAGVGRKSRIGLYWQQAFHVVGAATVGTAKNEPAEYWQLPYATEIDEVRIHVGTAPTGSSLIADVNVDGTTIFATQANRPTVAAAATDGTSGAPDVATYAKNDRLSIDLDQVGSTIAGADVTVMVRGRYLW